MIHVKHYPLNRDLELFIVIIERIWMILEVMWFLSGYVLGGLPTVNFYYGVANAVIFYIENAVKWIMFDIYNLGVAIMGGLIEGFFS